MARYALTIFLSAFLLFLVQPLIGKYILPWFGGTPAVWTTCMLFFQALLLGGYAYAHFLADRFAPRKQAAIHLSLLAISLVFLPIVPREFLKPTGSESPQLRILLLLAATIGGPYLMLSATGPLLQSWFTRTHPGRSPYRLYSLSNVGSLLALLGYPFLVEPYVRLWNQAVLWSGGFVTFVLLCGWCAIQLRRSSATFNMSSVAYGSASNSSSPATVASPTAPPRPQASSLKPLILLWLLLSMAGSIMLLATTNLICQEISVIPFLWIVPLALYLLSFVICFDNERWYARGLFLPFLGLMVVAWCLTLGHEALTRLIMMPGWFDESPLALFDGRISSGIDRVCDLLFGRTPMWVIRANVGSPGSLTFPAAVAEYLVLLFACVMTCHGELARSKPEPRHLTLFYLTIAAGGALGGVFVALIAPNVFPWFWEYQIGLAATCVAVLWAVSRDRSTPTSAFQRVGRLLLDAACVGLIPLVAILVMHVRLHDEDALFVARNFYGVLRINETTDDENGPAYSLTHGEINHGFQYQDAEKRRWATSYYARDTGISIATTFHPRRFADDSMQSALRIGVVGLGTGSSAALGKPGDYIRFYEINPAVRRLSDKWFTYINETPAKVDVILGDARVSMERELQRKEPQQFDILAVDAFSSDSIPMHLLTVECADIYWRHLKPDGILALHISNRYLNLMGVAQALATAGKREALVVDSVDDDSIGQSSATWVLITSNRAFLDNSAMHEMVSEYDEELPEPVLWTDDFGSLWQVLDL